MQYECKPARAAYEHVLSALKVRGDECILVEDSARNLKSARELGIHTILVLPDNPDLQPGTWVRANDLADPAITGRTRECPPTAELCIRDIYGVADAVEKLAAQSPETELQS